jgi:hypothetical protein
MEIAQPLVWRATIRSGGTCRRTVDLLLLGSRTVHASATAEFAPVELRE